MCECAEEGRKRKREIRKNFARSICQNGSNMVENGFKKTGNGRIEFEKNQISCTF